MENQIIKKSVEQILSLSIALFLCHSCNKAPDSPITQDELLQKVDSLLVNANEFIAPGTAVLVIKNGDILLNKGYGYANLEHEVPIGPNTVFDLASLSKQFTGFAISLLVEQGKIALDDDIRQYIPELPDFEHTITIEHLLHHTSGIRDWTSTLPLAGWSFDDVISYDQILRMAYAQKELNFVPGSQYSYSNTGYNILAELVQRVTGRFFAQWTYESIFLPLGMTDTRFLDDHRQVVPDRANGYYRIEDGPYQISPNNLTALGSSSLFSTTTDMAKWMVHLISPKAKIASVVERMYGRGTLNNGEVISYAFGLEIDEFRDTKRVLHTGSWASFTSCMILFPEHDLSVLVLNNHQKNVYATANEIASLYLPDAQVNNVEEGQGIYEPFELPTETLDQFTGTYRLGPAWYITVFREGNKIWGQTMDEHIFPMTAESDSIFRIPTNGGQTITFYRDISGTATHMEHTGMAAPKIKESSSVVPKNIIQYTGSYVSEELNTEYHVTYKDQQLKLRHFRHGELDLTAFGNDVFRSDRWFIKSIEFYRNKNNEIIGFYTTNERARNQWFQKTN
ncbi:serine hydrolase domain-containing protein [Ulvibacterium sp.]|uniref:serine hydrolase domain-containing protein n=1 Tax=Ulvibacterium sp. TaxID=2665914 RepID=UPI003BAB1EA4